MITPVQGKESIYKSYVKKMILATSGDEIIYRDLGLTVMAPDYEIIEHMTDVCKNFHIEYDMVDPSNSTSIGLNPFV